MTEEQKSYSKTSKRLSDILNVAPPKPKEKKTLDFLENYVPKKKIEKKIEPSRELPKYILSHNQPIFESPEQIAAKLNSLPEGLGSHVIKGLPTMDDIVNHIKSLKGNDRLDISNIRNGEHIAKMAQRVDMNDMRWHGSGTVSGSTVAAFLTTDIFTSSSGQTVFTTSKSPLFVFSFTVNGTPQTPTTDYVQSGSTFTLNNPIPANLPVIITYLNA